MLSELGIAICRPWHQMLTDIGLVMQCVCCVCVVCAYCVLCVLCVLRVCVLCVRAYVFTQTHAAGLQFAPELRSQATYCEGQTQHLTSGLTRTYMKCACMCCVCVVCVCVLHVFVCVC